MSTHCDDYDDDCARVSLREDDSHVHGSSRSGLSSHLQKCAFVLAGALGGIFGMLLMRPGCNDEAQITDFDAFSLDNSEMMESSFKYPTDIMSNESVSELTVGSMGQILHRAVCDYEKVKECVEFPDRIDLSPSTRQKMGQYLMIESILQRVIDNVFDPSETGHVAYLVRAAEAAVPGPEKLYDTDLSKKWVGYVAEKLGPLALALELAMKEQHCQELIRTGMKSIETPGALNSAARVEQTRRFLDKVKLPTKCQPKAVLSSAMNSSKDSTLLDESAAHYISLFNALPPPGSTKAPPPPQPLSSRATEFEKLANAFRVLIARFGCTPEDKTLCGSSTDRPTMLVEQWEMIAKKVREWNPQFLEDFGALSKEISALSKELPNFRDPKSPDGRLWVERMTKILDYYHASIDRAFLTSECHLQMNPNVAKALADVPSQSVISQRILLDHLYKCRQNSTTSHWLRKRPINSTLEHSSKIYTPPSIT